MYPVELEQLIRQGESQDVEFETSVPAPQDIARHVAALANTNGGTLILGVREPGEAVGVDEQRARAAIQEAQQHLLPVPTMKVETLKVNAHAVVVVQVTASEELHAAMGGYFARGTRPAGASGAHAEATRPMNPTEIRLHVLKGKTEEAALSRLAKAVADQTRTMEKHVDAINKHNQDSAKASVPLAKIAYALAGTLTGMILMYIIENW